MYPQPTARTVPEMIGYFQDRMQAGLARYDSEKKAIFDEGAAKTYLLETDLAIEENNKHDRITAFLREILPTLSCEVQELGDEAFYLITRPNSDASKDRSEQFYLQADDSRFWLLHTLAKSDQADRLQQELTRLPKIDSAWFPKQFLLDIARAKDNSLQGFSSRFDNEPFAKGDEERHAEFSLKLWGNLAREVLQVINSSDVLQRHAAISGVRVRRRVADDTVLDDVNCFGKATAFGASFTGHYDLVAYQIRRAYRRTIVDRIEDQLAIGLSGDNVLEGSPIVIRHQGLDLDLRAFVDAIFSGAGPFRLWGMAETLSESFARVLAVDMHVGHKLTFDIGNSIIRIELPRGSCGNTIARFFTLFQQHYDANASISGGDFETVFSVEEGA